MGNCDWVVACANIASLASALSVTVDASTATEASWREVVVFTVDFLGLLFFGLFGSVWFCLVFSIFLVFFNFAFFCRSCISIRGL